MAWQRNISRLHAGECADGVWPLQARGQDRALEAMSSDDFIVTLLRLPVLLRRRYRRQSAQAGTNHGALGLVPSCLANWVSDPSYM